MPGRLNRRRPRPRFSSFPRLSPLTHAGLQTRLGEDDVNERTIQVQFGHSNLFPIRGEVAIG
jgi:hypothetical protein